MGQRPATVVGREVVKRGLPDLAATDPSRIAWAALRSAGASDEGAVRSDGIVVG
jgi:hypothetical protein